MRDRRLRSLIGAALLFFSAAGSSAERASGGYGPPDPGDRAFVLCWHTFLGKPQVDTDFSLDEFAAQVDALLSLGYRFVGLEDLLFGRFSGGMNLVLTIDDGHRTIDEAVSKVLAPRGIAPAIFVFPAVIGPSAQYLAPGRLAALRDAGSAIGSHGYYHLYLNETLYRREKETFDREIFGSMAKVEALTGLPAYSFAYPFGTVSAMAKEEVARAGYSYGLAVKPGFVYADGRLNDPYELPRTVVTRAGWKETLAFLERNARGASDPAPASGSGAAASPGAATPAEARFAAAAPRALILSPALDPAFVKAPLSEAEAGPLAAFPGGDARN